MIDREQNRYKRISIDENEQNAKQLWTYYQYEHELVSKYISHLQ